MGYTNYWGHLTTIPQEQWDEFIKDCKKVYKNLPKQYNNEPLILSGCSRYKRPVFNKKFIWLNGSST